VPRTDVANRCGLDPALLDAADAEINEAYAVVRYGELCHEYYPNGPDTRTSIFHHQVARRAGHRYRRARDERPPRTGRKTGPLSDEPRDHWLDEFTFNRDARVANVLAHERPQRRP
jgi:hypothetical protein